MVRIPDARNIGLANPSGQTPIARMDVSRVGTGTAALASSLSGVAERRAEYQASKANTQFLTGYTREINSYDERPDYENFMSDYNKRSEELLTEAAEKIRDPRQRNLFIEQQRVRIAQGAEKIRDMAFAKETDFERGSVVDDLSALRDSAITATDDTSVADIMLSVDERLDAAVQMGYYSAEEKAKLMQQWRNSAATGRLEGMDPEDRLDALNQPWAENLPADLRAKIKDDAVMEHRQTKAIETVDGYLSQGMDQMEARRQMLDIKDPDLRRAVESRFDYQYARHEQAKVEHQSQLYDKYVEGFSDGSMTTDNITREDWDMMTPEVRLNLQAIQQEVATPTKQSDADALVQLATLNARKDYQGMAKFFSENSHKLKPSDRVKYAALVAEGEAPIELDDSLSDIQAINGRLAEAEITDKSAKDRILNNMSDWRLNYMRRFNKAPDDAERAKFIDRQLMDVVTDKGFLWDSAGRAYELSPAEWNNALNVMREEDPKTLKTVVEFFQSRNYEPTSAEIKQAYDRLRQE